MQQLQLLPLDEGELYVGAIGDPQGIVQHIILLPGDNDDASWSDQMAWAKSIGGALPTRVEQALLWERCHDQFQKDWYWSGEVHHSDSSSAWYQSFPNGDQAYLHEDTQLRAVAVRRLFI